MKNTSQNRNDNIQFNNKKNRPEVRDNLDSRKNEEYSFKGDDMNHNEKETKEDKLKKKD